MRAVLVALALALPAGTSAQIASSVRETEDGVVRFSYAVRPGVEICDQGVRMNDHSARWNMGRGDQGPTGCRSDVAEVELRVRSGEVRSLELVRDRDERARDAEDLGEVSPDEAARYLLDLARSARGDTAEEAVFPALLADVPELWRDLAELARDGRIDNGARKNALFWLGQEAADAAADELSDVALDEAEDQEVRDAAVFALSQRAPEQAVPMLMEIVETSQSVKTSRNAMFWLAQTEDPRVVDYFERILLGGAR